MKISFKVADYSVDRLVIVRTEPGGKHQTHECKKVVVRLFDEATVNRLVEAGNRLAVIKSSKKIL